MKNGAAPSSTVLNGKPGYINLLDAFNSRQLVRELKEATNASRRGELQACLSRGRGARPAAR